MSKPLTGVSADRKHSYHSFENIASYVRQQLNFTPDEAINPLRLFEGMHEICISKSDGTRIPLGYGVITLEDSEGYARYDKNRKLIEILASNESYTKLETNHPRAAYFVAHELGHCILHTDQLIRLAQMPSNQQAAFHRLRNNHQAFEDTEWQANAFAGALLMPARSIASIEQEYGYLDASSIVNKFGVSPEAARYRLELFRTRRDELL